MMDHPKKPTYGDRVHDPLGFYCKVTQVVNEKAGELRVKTNVHVKPVPVIYDGDGVWLVDTDKLTTEIR